MMGRIHNMIRARGRRTEYTISCFWDFGILTEGQVLILVRDRIHRIFAIPVLDFIEDKIDAS